MYRLAFRITFALLAACLIVFSGFPLIGQTAAVATPDVLKKDGKKPTPTPTPAAASKNPLKPETAEQLADLTIFIYGLPGGRATLNQIRKTTFERGKTSITGPDGKIDQASYQRFIIRADSLNKEKIRLDQEFPSARYSLVYSE